MLLAERIKPLVDDVSKLVSDKMAEGKKFLFEGAQGTLLDIDHGTYPYVTSSNCVAGAVSAGVGVSPLLINKVLGISKAYCTRVGLGPFPTELENNTGKTIAQKGHEFGATTGRARRCGWLDLVALKKSIRLNGITNLCLTKIDVLDGMDEVSFCMSYDFNGEKISEFPIGEGVISSCKPIFEQLPGWSKSTRGITKFDELPTNAKKFVETLEKFCEVPIDIISTGPDRKDTIIRNSLEML